jgi:hypothetical protein
MRITIRSMALAAGLVLALPGGMAAAPSQPSFESVAAAHRPDPWHTDPCGPHRPIAGICRMLRPVRG